MVEFPIFIGLWPWPLIRSYCIPSCITRRPLPTHQTSLKSKEFFVDGRTYVRMDGHLRPTNVMRSTRRRQPKYASKTYEFSYEFSKQFGENYLLYLEQWYCVLQWYFSNVNEYENENDCYSFTKTKTMLIHQTKII